jgi:hypothetical protein
MTAELPDWIKYRWVRPDGERYMKPPPFDREAFLAEYRAKKAAEELERDSMAQLSAARQAREERVRRQEILRLKSQIAALRFERAMVRHAMALERCANFNPNQPRVPAGNPDGGQWTSEGGGGSGGINDTRVISDVTSVDAARPGAQYAELRRPGIGHNNPPPDIPQQRPPTIQERNLIAKRLAQSGIAIAILETGPKWLVEVLAEIRSYHDAPRTLEDLQEAARMESRPGYQDHHIVGQVARGEPNKDFPDSKIDSHSNVVRIPTLTHREISGWYQTHNLDKPFYGRTPREYLRGKPWSERYRIGLEILRQRGVLLP